MNVNVNPGRETGDVCMVNHETEKGSFSKNKTLHTDLYMKQCAAVHDCQ